MRELRRGTCICIEGRLTRFCLLDSWRGVRIFRLEGARPNVHPVWRKILTAGVVGYEIDMLGSHNLDGDTNFLSFFLCFSTEEYQRQTCR
jgi:hypothetical protein